MLDGGMAHGLALFAVSRLTKGYLIGYEGCDIVTLDSRSPLVLLKYRNCLTDIRVITNSVHRSCWRLFTYM